MDFGSIFLILALALAVGLFISQPFFDRRETAGEQISQHAIQPEDHRRSALLAERDRLLTAVKELDFDYTLGKIPAEDYPIQRAEMLTAGAEVLRQLEEMGMRSSSPSHSQRANGESVQPPLRGKAAIPTEPGDELEELIMSHRRARQEKATGFCPRCGKPVRKSDKFCGRCGESI